MASVPHIVEDVLGPKTQLGRGCIVDRESDQGIKSLLQACGERAFRFAVGLTGNIENAKDLVQEAFRRLLQGWERFDPGRPIEHWLFSVLRRLCVDRERGWQRRHFVSLDGLGIDLPLGAEDEDSPLVAERIAAEEEGPLERLERQESADWIRCALSRLHPDLRAILELCDVEGMSYEEISRLVGCPIGTVRSRLSRARVAVRHSIERRLAVRWAGR